MRDRAFARLVRTQITAFQQRRSWGGWAWRRLRYALRSWPCRLGRCTQGKGITEHTFLLLDLLFVFDLYELLATLLSPRDRGLTPGEYTLLYPYFGDSVPYELIRIDERAHLGPRRGNFCYVSFHTINSWGPMSSAILVHEVVHVWQYTHRGAVYIPRALRAQRSELRYDYGGLNGLGRADELEDLNYEQMADVIEDAYRLANGYPAQWVRGRGTEVLPHYYPFLDELRSAPPAPC